MKRCHKSTRREQPTEGQLATLIPRVFHVPPTSTSGRSTQVLTSTIYASFDTTKYPRATLINIPQSSYTAWWLLIAAQDIPDTTERRTTSTIFTISNNFYVPVQNAGGLSIKPDFSKNYSVARQWASCVSVHSGTSTAGQLITGTLAAGVVSGIIDIDWRSATDINTKSINKKNALIGIPLEDGIIQIQGHDINRNYRPITDIGTIKHGNGAALSLGVFNQGQITIHGGAASAQQPFHARGLPQTIVKLTNWSFRARPIFYITLRITRFCEQTYTAVAGTETAITLSDTKEQTNGICTVITAYATITTTNALPHLQVSVTQAHYQISNGGSGPYHTRTTTITHNTAHMPEVENENVTILGVIILPPHDAILDQGTNSVTTNPTATVSGTAQIFVEIPDLYDKEITAPTHAIQWENVGQSQNIIVTGNQWIQAVSTPTQAQFTSATETMGNTEPSESSLSELYDGPDPVFKLSHVGKQYTALENKYKYHDDDST